MKTQVPAGEEIVISANFLHLLPAIVDWFLGTRLEYNPAFHGTIAGKIESVLTSSVLNY